MYDVPINSTGVFTGITSATDGATIAFANAEDLAQKISTLDAVRYCFAEHNFRAAFGTGTQYFDPTKAGATTLSAAEQSDYACEKDRLDYALTSNGNNVRALLKRLGSLRYRKDRSQ
jgi:signal transduction protein with GAF and PtsI domain